MADGGSGVQELAATIGRVNGILASNDGAAAADPFADLPPPPVDFQVGHARPRSDSLSEPVDVALEREDLWVNQLHQLFPDREVGSLRSIVRSSSTLDAAIDQVIASENVTDSPVRFRHVVQGRDRSLDQKKRQSAMIRPPTTFADDTNPPQTHTPVPAPRVRQFPAANRIPIKTVNTDDGFLDCPPPPDFVLEVNKVMWNPSDPEDPRYKPIAAPPTHSLYDDVDDQAVVFNAADEPVFVQSKFDSGVNRKSESAVQKPSTASLPKIQTGDKGTRTDTTTDYGFDEFDGFESADGFDSEGNYPEDEAIDVSPLRPTKSTAARVHAARLRAARASPVATTETAIPATDEELRKTVEDLVELKLRRSGSGRRQSEYSDSDSLRSESVASTVSVEALSEIVSQTVDRLLNSPRYKNDDTFNRDSGRHSWNSRGSRSSIGSRGSGGRGSPLAFFEDIDDLGAVYPGYEGTHYVAQGTMDQLRPPSFPPALPTPPPAIKAKVKESIRKLTSGRGGSMQGQRVYVRRDQKLGFGFSMAGESPTYVRAVVPHGPADCGREGLLAGDIIMKVGNKPVATMSRATLLPLIEAVPTGEFLVLVVARTPPMPRKRIQSDPTLASSKSPLTPTLASPVSHSGWLHILSTENKQLVWQRRWTVLGDDGLQYYASPDSNGTGPITPLGEISLRDACCSACGKSDGMRRDAAFKVVYRASPAVYLSAPNMKSMWEWIRRLNSVSKITSPSLQ